MSDTNVQSRHPDQPFGRTGTFQRDMAGLNPTHSWPIQIDGSVRLNQLFLGLQMAGLSLKRDKHTGVYVITP
jgi:hypothetical protein